jgi:hypothetical protein
MVGHGPRNFHGIDTLGHFFHIGQYVFQFFTFSNAIAHAKVAAIGARACCDKVANARKA